MLDIIGAVENQAEWRRGKATQYPNDIRNRRSAELLEELAKNLHALPGDDPAWKQFTAAYDNALDQLEKLGSPEKMPLESDILGRFGFDGGTSDAREFLNDMAQLYDDAVAEAQR